MYIEEILIEGYPIMKSSEDYTDYSFFQRHQSPTVSEENDFEELIKVNNINISHSHHTSLFKKSKFCPELEQRHLEVLEPESPLHKKGCVIILNELPIGYVKFRGNRTFMSWYTIKSENRYPIIFSGAYAITKKLYERIKSIPFKTGRWNQIKLNHLALSPGRTIGLDYTQTDISQKIVEYLIKERENFLHKYRIN